LEKAIRDEIRQAFRMAHAYSEDFTMKNAVKLSSTIAGEPSNKPLFKKEVEEIVEQAWILRARDICQEHKLPKEIFEMLVAAHKSMPTLSTRTSSSMLGQAYSTPTPIAYIMSLLAGVDDTSYPHSVWEPTPGNGALLINLESKYRAMGFEIDPMRYEFVTQTHRNIKQRDWLVNPPIWQEFPAEGIEHMIGNPPFGKGDRMKLVKMSDKYSLSGIFRKDLYIILQSLAFLSLTGRAAFLMGAPLAAQIGDMSKLKSAYRTREIVLAWRHILANYKVTHHVTIHGKLYSKQGSSFPVDLLVVKGRGVTHGGLPGVTYTPQLISSWEELAAIKPLDREYSDPA
jgi:hypothetical protein